MSGARMRAERADARGLEADAPAGLTKVAPAGLTKVTPTK
jgi:hypothetical protein